MANQLFIERTHYIDFSVQLISGYYPFLAVDIEFGFSSDKSPKILFYFNERFLQINPCETFCLFYSLFTHSNT